MKTYCYAVRGGLGRGELTLAGIVLRRGGNSGIVISCDECIVEHAEVCLGPAIVVGLDDADGLAAVSSQGQQRKIVGERANTHCSDWEKGEGVCKLKGESENGMERPDAVKK